MPILFLVDTSLSMGTPNSHPAHTPISSETGYKNSRISYAKLIIKEMIKATKTSIVPDYITIATYDATVNFIFKLSIEYDACILSVDQKISLTSNSNLFSALGFVKDALKSHQPSQPTQIIVFTDDIDQLKIFDQNKCDIIPNLLELHNSSCTFLMFGANNMTQTQYEVLSSMLGSLIITVPDISTPDSLHLFVQNLNDQLRIGSRIRLKFGNILGPISTLWPPPIRKFEGGKKNADTVSDVNILGFVHSDDIKLPSIISQHLIISIPENDEQRHEESFNVLLHGSIKMQSTLPIVKFRSIYGYIETVSDGKKKSCLCLNLFNKSYVNELTLSCTVPLAIAQQSLDYEDKSEEGVNDLCLYSPHQNHSYNYSNFKIMNIKSIQSDLMVILKLLPWIDSAEYILKKKVQEFKQKCILWCFPQMLTTLHSILSQSKFVENPKLQSLMNYISLPESPEK